MTAYALVALLCGLAVLPPAFLIPQFRKTGFILCGVFLLIALALFAADCAITCVRTGEIYVPKR